MTAEARRSGSGLGRGLAALIPQRQESRATVELPIAMIARNPYQPRQTVEQQALEQLAQSVAEHGILQPILVSEGPDGYRLVAGERRLRAAEMAGLERIPALVRTVEERDQLAFALVENLQRADLNPLEQARAFRLLVDEFGLTQDEVARRVGRSRSAVANILRLLELAPDVQAAVKAGKISEGHARALGGLDNHSRQVELLNVIVPRGLSVRQTEDLVRRLRDDQRPTSPADTEPVTRHGPELERIESSLRTVLGTKVSVNAGRRGGRIIIEYYDDDDLSRIHERLLGGSHD